MLTDEEVRQLSDGCYNSVNELCESDLKALENKKHKLQIENYELQLAQEEEKRKEDLDRAIKEAEIKYEQSNKGTTVLTLGILSWFFPFLGFFAFFTGFGHIDSKSRVGTIFGGITMIRDIAVAILVVKFIIFIIFGGK